MGYDQDLTQWLSQTALWLWLHCLAWDKYIQRKKSHKTDPKKALKSLPDDIVKVVLAHQPASIFKVHEAKADLQLSGHTHGGQFWPFTYPTRWANPYLEGLHNHKGTQIYVNRGTGYWGPPLRLGVESEITLVTLETKKKQ
mgnify:CR=1 FL=1